METSRADYLAVVRQAFPDKNEPELELMMSGSRRLQQYSGLTAHEHRRRGMEKLFPSRIWHEWREERVASIQYCLEHRIQECMWMGSSNSNKTADAADTALALWWTKPELTSIYIASPYETATETGVWAYILEQFEEARGNYPSLPGKVRTSDSSIVLYERNPRSFIRVATVDQVGKLVGKKAKDFTQGLLVIILDELPAFTAAATRALFGVMPNLISVPNLLVLGTGNFANVGDALGVFCDPDERDIVNGYDGFDPDRHFRWRTKRGGLCLRFDGLQSPNVKAGVDKYPFLTTLAYIAKLAAAPGGLQSANAMRFVRSAPVTSLDEFTVTNAERLRAGGCYDKFEWTADTIRKGCFIDPGFGGDACILQKFNLGFAKIPDGKRQIVAMWEEPVEIPIKIGLKEDGKEITAEKQIVRACRTHCEQHGVPTTAIGFDGSMRAGIVQEFAKWSHDIIALDSQGAATARPVNATEKKKEGKKDVPVLWKDKVDRLLSELWFAVSSLVDSYQLRNLQVTTKAVEQLTKRRWEWSGSKKRRVQTKPEYKAMLQAMNQVAESPNHADALVGCVEIARRMGLSLEGVVPGGGAVELLLSMLRQRDAHAQFRRAINGQGLPSGSLHAMKRESTKPSGRLSRR